MDVFQVLKQRCHKSAWFLHCITGTVAAEFIIELVLLREKCKYYGIRTAVRVNQEKSFDLGISKTL